jgi:hypothetical protein
MSSLSPCVKGKIERIGYEYNTKSGTLVKVKKTCIEDKGKPGKGPKLIIIPKEDEGLLTTYGYSLKDSYEKRIKALKKANKNEDKLKVLRHVNALRTLQKSNEKYYNKLDRDFKWLQQNYNKKIDK